MEEKRRNKERMKEKKKKKLNFHKRNKDKKKEHLIFPKQLYAKYYQMEDIIQSMYVQYRSHRLEIVTH